MYQIESFEVHRLTLPLGRMIGDNNCNYQVLDLVVVSLRTNQGNSGWGYSESAWQGRFKHDAWYIRPMPAVARMEADLMATWWPLLQGRNPMELEAERTGYSSGFPYLDAAVRLAIWDLMAQEKGVPLYRLLNPATTKKEALAYGSILDFPLSDREVLDLTQKFLLDGFGTIKVKIGADDVERDIRRLKLLRSYAGDTLRLTADANEAWDWKTALDRIEAYLKNDIRLEYIEDPLPRNDVSGFAELTKRSPIPIIGHDYINDFASIERLAEEGGLNGLRTGKDIDYALRCIGLADRLDIPVYLGNSMFEMNAHLALAFDRVDRMEFSRLATNDILQNAIQFSNGMVQAPTDPGHGLFPTNENLLEYASDTEMVKPKE
jgi:L-alanine-DL-glutamate epimerase-like enolase superfamily enzyme